MRSLLLFLPLVLTAGCAQSGIVSTESVAVDSGWRQVRTRDRIRGGKQCAIRIELPLGGRVDYRDWSVCTVFVGGQKIALHVEVLNMDGVWSEVPCGGEASSHQKTFVLFSLDQLSGAYETMRIRASGNVVLPGITWVRYRDL
jgi:hypothetical protein